MTERPYRSHLQPACYACRHRKSRCKRESAAASCLMCQVHGTSCEFPARERTTRSRKRARDVVSVLRARSTRSEAADARQTPRSRHHVHRRTSARLPKETSRHQENPNHETAAEVAQDLLISQTLDPTFEARIHRDFDRHKNADPFGRLSDITLGEDDTHRQGPHIVGPMATNDATALQEYLGDGRKIDGARIVRPATRSGRPESRMNYPILFKTISKHPIGIVSSQRPGRSQLQIIEKLIEPHANLLIDAYFEHLNDCFPLLDASSFRRHYKAGRENLSPALLACLYANSMILWSQTIGQEEQRCPDVRFIWVQAEDAIRAELLLSPGMSTIVGMLLDIGGRPTTSMLGNAISMGAAVSLSHALGLNRDPSDWSIPDEEKVLRIRLWWAVVINDRWCSLAYGTPPHIHRSQYDVPMPLPSTGHGSVATLTDTSVRMFYYLCSLTVVLGECLVHVYHLDTPTLPGKPSNHDTGKLLGHLESWEKSLDAQAKAAVIYGESHEIDGAANLRLAYLSLRMHILRIRLDECKSNKDWGLTSELRTPAEEAAEQIVNFVVQLRSSHILGFWHPVSAFSIASACTLLIRCAIECHAHDPAGLRQSNGVKRASELLATLKIYRVEHAWDVGDICISQCEKVVQELLEANGLPRTDRSERGLADDLDSEVFAIGELFPSVWDLIESDYASELFAE